MRPADSAFGIFRNLNPDLCVLRFCVPVNPEFITGVACVFHLRIVNTPPASISIHFRKFSARQLSEITIVKRSIIIISKTRFTLLYIVYIQHAKPKLGRLKRKSTFFI